MGEVHHPQDAEDQGEAEGDQGIYGPERHPVDELLEEEVH